MCYNSDVRSEIDFIPQAVVFKGIAPMSILFVVSNVFKGCSIHEFYKGWNKHPITSSSRQTFSIPLLFSSSCKAVTAAELPGTLQTFNNQKHNVEVGNKKKGQFTLTTITVWP